MSDTVMVAYLGTRYVVPVSPTTPLPVKSVIDQTTPGTTDRVTVGGSDVIDVLPTLYAAGAVSDGVVLFNPIAITNAARTSGGLLGLQSIEVLDEDDLGLAFDLIFMDASSNLGTLGSAPNITDANARKIIGRVSIATGDYYDLGASRFASVHNVGLMMKSLAGRDIYVAGIARGAGTYTANGLRLKFGVAQD